MEFKTVGVVKDAQGLKGEIFVRLFAGESDWLAELSKVRLKSAANAKVDIYELERARRHKNGLVLKLRQCEDRNQAEALRGREFEIPKALLIAKVGDQPYLDEILGFEVTDSQLGRLGVVRGFGTNGAQDLLLIPRGSSEVMVPFIKEFVEKIDFQTQQIFMRLPEGLIED